MSIRTKIVGSFLLGMLLIIANISVIFVSLDQQSDDALLVNLAGRQRMLSQRISKNVFITLASGSDSTEASELARAEMMGAINLYDSTINGFMSGGTVIDANGNEVEINRIEKDSGTLASAYEVWVPFKENALKVHQNGDRTAAAYVAQNNNELLVRSNSIVVELQKSAEAKLSFIKNFQYIILVLSITVLIILSYFVQKLVANPIKDIAEISRRMAIGDLRDKVTYTSKDEIGLLADSMNKLIDNMNEQAQVAKKIADGDFDVEIKVLSEHDVLNKNHQLMIENMRNLTREASRLVRESQNGQLNVRGDSDTFKGGWKELIDQINELIDTVEKPICYVSDYISHMASGSPMQKVVDKDEINLIYTDFITGESEEAFKNEYSGNFGEMIDNLELVRLSIYSMLENVLELTDSAKEGKLSFRADEEGLNGFWRQIIEGFNESIDAFIDPIDEAARVLEAMRGGNLHVRVKGDYKGDHSRIKNALNETVETQMNYIGEISRVLDTMAKGNMDIEIQNEFAGDFDSIRISLNTILHSLNDILKDIKDSAIQVASGAENVSDSAQQLSIGATQQSNTLQSIKSSITRISDQTEDNAESAEKAKVLSNQSLENAIMGNDHMKEMLGAMEGINESSSNISSIIKVIDEIAFQTNILALNAAVEAARAGEHGKGFAVVAEEVRNLAARSASAARETTDLIEDSIGKVAHGTKIANLTSDALDKIVTGISETTSIVEEIATASVEQSDSLNEINEGIVKVTAVTQSNASAAEESAAASEEMSAQATTLENMISTFRLRDARRDEIHNSKFRKTAL